jgi:hypothetical protein
MDDDAVEDDSYLKTIQEMDAGTSDALLILDTEKKIRFIGKITEDLLSLRSQYAIGQNISDACRDQSFAGTAIDLTDSALQSLGETQSSTLDINGISRNITAIAHKNSKADIRFILITVKLGG